MAVTKFWFSLRIITLYHFPLSIKNRFGKSLHKNFPVTAFPLTKKCFLQNRKAPTNKFQQDFFDNIVGKNFPTKIPTKIVIKNTPSAAV